MAILIYVTGLLAACAEARWWSSGLLQSRSWRLLIGKAFGLMLMIIACAVGISMSNEPEQSLTEHQIKAAFLYNFAKFIEWPSETFKNNGAPMILGVLGKDPIADALEQTIKGKSVNGRPLVIKRLKADQDLKCCHILFISSSEGKHLAKIMESLKGLSVLTVGDLKRFTQLGGIIKFTMEQSKVRFEINVDSAERARLKISAKLLALAKVVRDEPHGGKS